MFNYGRLNQMTAPKIKDWYPKIFIGLAGRDAQYHIPLIRFINCN